MATLIEPGEVVFLDTGYAIALSAPTDQFHQQALRLAGELESANAKMVATRAILLEIGNSLARHRYRTAAVALLDAFVNDPQVEILDITAELYSNALDLFRSRMDKEWGLIDCISFVVMIDRKLTKALTADEHFQQCGFRALLREVGG